MSKGANTPIWPPYSDYGSVAEKCVPIPHKCSLATNAPQPGQPFTRATRLACFNLFHYTQQLKPIKRLEQMVVAAGLVGQATVLIGSKAADADE